MSLVLHINKDDNVVNALNDLEPNIKVKVDDKEILVKSAIPRGHKMAIEDINEGGTIVKYGQMIGIATQDIAQGEHVHVHNVKDPISNWKAQYLSMNNGDL